MRKHRFSGEDCVYMGYDRTGLEAMQEAGHKVASVKGTRLIKKISDITLKSHGRAGAVRESAEMVLNASGINEIDLPNV